MATTTLNLGNLVVTIKGDTKDVEAAEKKVRRSLKDIEKSGQDTEKAISRAITQMGARFLSFAAVVATVNRAVVQFQNVMKGIPRSRDQDQRCARQSSLARQSYPPAG